MRPDITSWIKNASSSSKIRPPPGVKQSGCQPRTVLAGPVDVDLLRDLGSQAVPAHGLPDVCYVQPGAGILAYDLLQLPGGALGLEACSIIRAMISRGIFGGLPLLGRSRRPSRPPASKRSSQVCKTGWLPIMRPKHLLDSSSCVSLVPPSVFNCWGDFLYSVQSSGVFAVFIPEKTQVSQIEQSSKQGTVKNKRSRMLGLFLDLKIRH